MSRRSLYAQVMGDDFDDLDEAVRRFHSLRGQFSMQGHCRIDGPTSLAGRLLGFISRTPAKATQAAFAFELHADEYHERWTRHFPGRRMISTMRVKDGVLTERLGLTTFRFRLHAIDNALYMELVGFSVLGIPLPGPLRPRIMARETGSDGVFHFDVAAALPLVGRITAYTGHIELPSMERTHDRGL